MYSHFSAVFLVFPHFIKIKKMKFCLLSLEGDIFNSSFSKEKMPSLNFDTVPSLEQNPFLSFFKIKAGEVTPCQKKKENKEDGGKRGLVFTADTSYFSLRQRSAVCVSRFLPCLQRRI